MLLSQRSTDALTCSSGVNRLGRFSKMSKLWTVWIRMSATRVLACFAPLRCQPKCFSGGPKPKVSVKQTAHVSYHCMSGATWLCAWKPSKPRTTRFPVIFWTQNGTACLSHGHVSTWYAYPKTGPTLESAMTISSATSSRRSNSSTWPLRRPRLGRKSNRLTV